MVACHVFRIRGLVRLIHVMTEQELTRQIIALRDPMFRFARTLLLRQAMARMPHRQREALHLKEIEGFATKEIAAIFATDEAQVRVMLSRARCRLGEEVEKLMDHGTK